MKNEEKLKNIAKQIFDLELECQNRNEYYSKYE